MQNQAAIDRLDRDIQQLKIEFERFFSGNLPTPPEDYREAVRRQIYKLRAAPSHALVDRFRLNTLEARFNTLNELYNRRLREREEGATAPTSRSARATPRRYDPYKGIVVGDTPPKEAIEALYDELYDDEKTSPSNFAKFQTYLLGQMAAIRERSGCDEVKFRVATEGGKVKLKAKPIRPARMSAEGDTDSG